MRNPTSLIHHNTNGNLPQMAFSEIHPAVYIITLLAWAWVLAGFWFTFGGEGEGALVIAVSTFYCLIFFTVPISMIHTAKKFAGKEPQTKQEKSFHSFLESDVGTLYGPLTGREVLIQITLVPICLALCVSGIAYAVFSARHAVGF